MTNHTPYGLLWQAQDALQLLLALHREAGRGSAERARLDRVIKKAQARQARRWEAERASN